MVWYTENAAFTPIMMELNKIYYMDCVDGIKQLEDNSVQLVVTPPYAMQRKFQYGGINEKDYPEWTLKWTETLKPNLKDNHDLIKSKVYSLISNYDFNEAKDEIYDILCNSLSKQLFGK